MAPSWGRSPGPSAGEDRKRFMMPMVRKPPTVRLDGDKVRLLREGKGLTQLYVAEVAKVSVDTVSRWENNRTAAVKRENAQALADALETPLEGILLEEPSRGTEFELGEEAEPTPRPRLLPWLAGVAILVLLALWAAWRATGPEPFAVETLRRLPPYTPPGSAVPVVVQLRTLAGTGQRVVLRETLPAGWSLLGASPEPDQGPTPDGTLKWILPLEEGAGRVAYLVQAPADGAAEGSAHRFSGEVVTPGAEGTGSVIRGENRIDLEYVHWADQNADFQISDAEVLDALERLEGAQGLGLDPEDLRRLWGAAQYEWDRTRGRFEPR